MADGDTVEKPDYGNLVPGRGRPKGVRNKQPALLKDALMIAASNRGNKMKALAISRAARHGATQEELDEIMENQSGSLVGFLEWTAEHHTVAFCGMLGRVLPLQVKVESRETVTYKSVEEIDAEIRRRQLALKRLQPLLELSAIELSNGDDSNINHG